MGRSGLTRHRKHREELDAVGPAFQLYASDWLGSTKIALMTAEQEGAYIHLLAHEWGNPACALPDDDDALAKLSRLGDRWPDLSGEIRVCFVPHATLSERLINPRLYAIWLEQREFRRHARESGKHGASKRWPKERRARRAPSDFELTDERLQAAIAEGLDETAVRREFAKFLDHEFQKPRSDWPAAWRNWMRGAIERATGNAQRGPRTAGEQSMANLRTAAEELGLRGGNPIRVAMATPLGSGKGCDPSPPPLSIS